MVKISFILPCYNVFRYIEDCLDSIYNQGMSEEDFEVICVNDCSTDCTRDLIIKYAKRHSNLFLIDHDKNQTAGGARNTGIFYAHGEYIWFVDPDDVIKPNCVQSLYTHAKQKEIDVLFFNFDCTDEELNIVKKTELFGESEVLPGQDYVLKYFPGKLSQMCIVWRCLFKREFILENDLRYPIMRKAQDVAFLWRVLMYANRICSVPDVCYSNRGNPYSVAKMKTKANVVFSERILFANEINSVLNEANIEIRPLIREDMTRALKWCVNSNLDILSKMPKEELENYYDDIVKHKELIGSLKSFMNRKSRFLFCVNEGKRIWLKKVKMLSKTI